MWPWLTRSPGAGGVPPPQRQSISASAGREWRRPPKCCRRNGEGSGARTAARRRALPENAPRPPSEGGPPAQGQTKFAFTGGGRGRLRRQNRLRGRAPNWAVRPPGEWRAPATGHSRGKVAREVLLEGALRLICGEGATFPVSKNEPGQLVCGAAGVRTATEWERASKNPAQPPGGGLCP